MKKPLLQALQGKFYLDGGTGSLFIERGLVSPHPELFNITHPDAVASIQRDYFLAGADAVVTNTFGCNARKADLTQHSLSEIILSAIAISKSIAREFDGYVLYDCGPTGGLLQRGKMTFEEAYELFAEQAKIVQGSGVDGVIIETVGDLQEMRSAYLAFRENTDLPVLCSMTFEKGGHSFAGAKVESYGITMQALGADAIGINCGSGPIDMYDNAKRLLSVVNIPVFIEPNAGIPRFEKGRTVYDTDAVGFAKEMKKIAELGIHILGGCCGTTPDFIRQLVAETRSLPMAKTGGKIDAVCSFSRVAEFGKKCLVIGERLNPTGKPLLKQAILEDDKEYLLSVCVSEMNEGADILDVNLGMAGIDEEKKLLETIEYIQGVADAPLCVDTTKKCALEKAVRLTCGRCIINSVNASYRSMSDVFPIAKKYGSYIVALCMDDKGIPETVEGRLDCAERILEEGKKYGIKKDRFLFDPLTMAVSVNPENALITLETLKKLDEKGVKTTLGLSNISFGLPNRPLLNGAFYKMALSMNVSSAIINPTLVPNDNPQALSLLQNKDFRCEKYLAYCAGESQNIIENKQKDLKTLILQGLSGEALSLVKKDATSLNYAEIIDKEVIGGLNELGARFSEGKVFLPQLMAGSETAKVVLEYLRENFIREGNGEKATVVLATVKGDVHDIGKNIVKAVVANYGYRIIDLGKDVPAEEIVKTAKEEGARVVGLSALMTTTLDSMALTAKLVKETLPDVIVMVGGAVVSPSFASQIGAIYTKDAQQMAEELEKMFLYSTKLKRND